VRTLTWLDWPEGAANAAAGKFYAIEDIVVVSGNALPSSAHSQRRQPAPFNGGWLSVAVSGEAPTVAGLRRRRSLWGFFGTPATVIAAPDGGGLSPPPPQLVPGVPHVHSLGPGLAAGTPALAFALLDWLMAPTAALAKRVRIVTSSYPRHTGYVIALHMRIGAEAAAAADANFEDPGRDDPVKAAAQAAACADIAARALAALHGPRPRALWYVAADNARARALLLATAVGRTVDGVPISALELPIATIVHVDRTKLELVGAARLRDGFIDAYAEHFLLSAADAIVRSRSGFSESAQAWGRIGFAIQYHAGIGECRDASEETGNQNKPPKTRG
jgi:hypothetical protein